MTPETSVPTIAISQAETDPGWRRVETGEKVQTLWQVYSFAPPGASWRLSTFWSAEGFVNRGRSNYREATSLRNRLLVLSQFPAKLLKRIRNGWILSPA